MSNNDEMRLLRTISPDIAINGINVLVEFELVQLPEICAHDDYTHVPTSQETLKSYAT